YHREDENYKDSCLLNDTQRFNCTSEDKCLSPIGFDYYVPGCKHGEHKKPKSEVPTFPILCTSRKDAQIEDYEAIETNCEWWPCNNPYTRCDKYFHCANGIDELNCPDPKCKINEYQYSTIFFPNYYCIPQEYIYEMPLDCTNNNISDLCRKIFYSNSSTININNEYISWKNKSCLTTDDICGSQSINDEKSFCPLLESSDTPKCSSFFSDLYDSEILPDLISATTIMRMFFVFSTWNIGNLPSEINSNQQLIDTNSKETL
ncbi:unnamed protein product, partial [Adineta steineri]